MIYRDFAQKIDFYPICRLLDDFWLLVHGQDLNRCIESNGLKFNGIEGKLYQFLNEGCKIRVAESEGTLVGFLIYHLIYDVICVTRGIYFVPQKRNQGCMYGMYRDMVKNGLKRIYSQTYVGREPAEMSGESRRRKLVCTQDDMHIWEYRIGGE